MRDGGRFWNRDVVELVTRKTGRLSNEEVSLFCRKLSFMLDAGIPVRNALPSFSESFAERRGGSRKMKKIIGELHTRVLRGEGFAAACSSSGAFPDFMCGLCSVGEASASLPLVAGLLTDYYEQRSRAANEIKAALIYPAAVAVMMLAVMAVAAAFVLPEYARVFAASGAELPAATKAALTAADFVSNYFVHILVCAALAAAGVFLFARNPRGKKFLSRLALHSSLYQRNLNLIFARSLYILLSSGLRLTDAVRKCAESVANARASEYIIQIAAGLEEGKPFWRLLGEVYFFDPLFSEMARVGEETGRLAQSIEKCQNYFARELSHSINRFNKLLGPAITVALGLLLLLLALVVLLPTFSLIDVI